MSHALTLGWYLVPMVIVFFTASLCAIYFFFAFLIAKNSGHDVTTPARYAMVSIIVAMMAGLWPIMLIGSVMYAVFLMVRSMFTKKEN